MPNPQIASYLEKVIAQLPNQPIPVAQTINFSDIRVPIIAKKVDSNVIKPLEDLAREWLLDEDKQSKVLFVQGTAGRGKSGFCWTFANWLRENPQHRWIPVLIQLRYCRELRQHYHETLREAFKQTLEQSEKSYLKSEEKQQVDFTQNDNWLKNSQTRFLFLIDGLDEFIEGRNTGILEQLLEQLEVLRRECQQAMPHRILLTGRQLSLQNVSLELENVKRLLINFERVEILPMDEPLQKYWQDKWNAKIRQEDAQKFEEFLQDERWNSPLKELIKEPLLRTYLASWHRRDWRNNDIFQNETGSKVKIKIYQECLNQVLTQQRPKDVQAEITKLEIDKLVDKLLPILAEAGLCVVQSGGESTLLKTLQQRLEDQNQSYSDDDLKNALGTFYIDPVGLAPQDPHLKKVKFLHNSFRDYLFAERLKTGLQNLTIAELNDNEIDKEIYDLLGYGNLTKEIVQYLMALLQEDAQLQWEQLFNRLEGFYLRWYHRQFQEERISPFAEQEKQQLDLYGIQLKLSQVNVYALLNVMILLLELDRYARSKDKLRGKIAFYPCGKKDSEENPFDSQRLYRVIQESFCLPEKEQAFGKIVGQFLSQARLSDVFLSGVQLRKANLSKASLIDANLIRVDLEDADLSGAYLNSTDFNNANLTRANLSNANLSDADLSDANLKGANLSNAYLGGAKLRNAKLNQSDNPVKQTNLSNAIFCSADLSEANLSGANVDNADFLGAAGKGAILQGTQNRPKNRLDQSREYNFSVE